MRSERVRPENARGVEAVRAAGHPRRVAERFEADGARRVLLVTTFVEDYTRRDSATYIAPALALRLAMMLDVLFHRCTLRTVAAATRHRVFETAEHSVDRQWFAPLDFLCYI